MRSPRFLAAVAATFVSIAPAYAQRVQTRLPAKRPPAPTVPAKDSSKTTPVGKPAVPTAPGVASSFARVQGVASDSVHGVPLAKATIEVEGTGRSTSTDSLGAFALDSIPPGRYRLLLDHPMLDTMGISLASDTLTFVANETAHAAIAIPTGERIAELFCPPARRLLGPGVVIGRVRNADSDSPAVGVRVSLVWFGPDIPGIPAALQPKKSPRLREAIVGADGTYRLCGLPSTFEGKLQAQRKEGGETSEVAVAQTDGVLTLRSLSVPAPPRIAGADSAGWRAHGTARVTGRVLNAGGAPIVGARVGLMGVSAATQTRANGEFALDSLPSGTQSLVVRQIGYRPTEVPVELSAREPARVTVQLGTYVPELSPVRVLAVREEGLQRVGFTNRKRTSAGGTFMDTEMIERRQAQAFTDLLRAVPGIQVQQTGGNSQTQLISTRSAGTGTGCVTVFVDGAPWQQLQAGDLDSFVRPDEVAAVEVYQGTYKPAEFTTPGQDCAAVVVWTKTRVQSTRRK